MNSRSAFVAFAKHRIRPAKEWIKMMLLAVADGGRLKNSMEVVDKAPHPRILLISHELSATGAPRVLYYVAKHLLEAGNSPVVVSAADGPIRSMFDDLGIPVIIAPLILTGHSVVLQFARLFDCIIANTIVTWPIVRQMQASNTNIPILWYLHESSLIPQLIRDNPVVGDVLKNADRVLAVSQRVARFVASFNSQAQILPYGVPDVALPLPNTAAKPIVFSIIGSLEPRKGQDIFVKAAIELEKTAGGLARFHIIGRTLDARWAAQLKSMADNYSNIHFLGEVDLNVCLEAMKSSDVIVCPSRDDPLPLAATDGFCLGKAVICSDATGHADFITQGVNGMIVQSGSVAELADAMCRLLKNPEFRKDMGIEARKTFLLNFSEQVFAGRINNLVKANLKGAFSS